MAENSADREQEIERRGFHAGAAAMKRALLAHFGRVHPAGFLRGAEVCNGIAETPLPVAAEPTEAGNSARFR